MDVPEPQGQQAFEAVKQYNRVSPLALALDYSGH